ncbi:MAG: hypothetical protein Q4A60_09305 [Pasteurellaceae bacterium]|nr:hypothetical protein [Pasteurellaceae bacterium]
MSNFLHFLLAITVAIVIAIHVIIYIVEQVTFFFRELFIPFLVTLFIIGIIILIGIFVFLFASGPFLHFADVASKKIRSKLDKRRAYKLLRLKQKNIEKEFNIKLKISVDKFREKYRDELIKEETKAKFNSLLRELEVEIYQQRMEVIKNNIMIHKDRLNEIEKSDLSPEDKSRLYDEIIMNFKDDNKNSKKV